MLLLTSALIAFTMSFSGIASVSNTNVDSQSTCDLETSQFNAVPNSLTSDSLEGIYGYSNLYYLPNNPSRNVVLVSNGKELVTKQGMLDDIEGMVSIERYIQSCTVKEIIVVRARYFESGLESINELGYIYSKENNSNLHFIGKYDFVIGGDKEYEMLMNDDSLLPSDFKDLFSKLDFGVVDGELHLSITNFLHTNTQVKTFTLIKR